MFVKACTIYLHEAGGPLHRRLNVVLRVVSIANYMPPSLPVCARTIHKCKNHKSSCSKLHSKEHAERRNTPENNTIKKLTRKPQVAAAP